MRTRWQPVDIGGDDLGLVVVIRLTSWLLGVEWRGPDDYEGQFIIALALGPLAITFNRYCADKVDPDAEPF